VPDLQVGIEFASLGGGTAYNFVSFVESAGMFFGDPNRQFKLLGMTVVYKVTGNKGDDASYNENDPNNAAAQNLWRNFIDCYMRADTDKKWQKLKLLDGNAAQKAHLDDSKSETAGRYVGRSSLQHRLSGDGTELNGTPMARDDDVNVAYIEINRLVKTFWLRFGQETAVSVNHNSIGGENERVGMRLGDFNIVGVTMHVEADKGRRAIMDEGNMSEQFAITEG